jgi:hypothetical protein
LRFIRSPDVLTLERRPRQFAAAQKLASARAYRLEYPARFPQPRVLAAIIRDLPRATQGQRPRSD